MWGCGRGGHRLLDNLLSRMLSHTLPEMGKLRPERRHGLLEVGRRFRDGMEFRLAVSV